ncbi:MAG TPA: hypothetical protein VEP49_21905, partial [Acidimicrobiia bacterium]|nr:hypothetical protein [Acidimicrobiia bacterium]
AVAFGAAEGAIGTVLARLRDHRTWLGAMRAEIPMELLTVPLGLVGAVAGDAGASVGWWLATLVLVPTLFVPELVLVPRRSAAARFVHLAAPVATGAALLAVVALVAPWPDAPTLVGLLVLALLAGLELRVDARRPVPAMAAAVVAAALVVSGGADFAGAVMVAIAATVTAGILARTGQWWAPVLAAAAAAAAAGIVDAHASRAGVVLAVVVFEVVALAPLDRVVWTAPIVGTAVALATVWGVVGAPGALAFGAGLAVAGRAAVACGAPPWRSRILGPRAARRPAPGVRWRWYVAVAAATGCSVGAATTASARDLLVPTAAAAVSAIAAMGALAARQWRFAPRRRVRDGAVTLAAAGAAVLAYPPLALDGDWSALVVLAAALVAATTVLRPLARRAERAAAAAAPSDVSGVAAR